MTLIKRTVAFWAMLAIAIALVMAGGVTAAMVQTSAGQVEVRDTRFIGAEGRMVSGLLYVPSGTTSENPAPAVLSVHGYINSREMQTAAAVELARRGYVVLTIDQSGHGRSDAPAFSNGFNGPAALSYLRSLSIVDADNIGLTGHSLGGSTVMAAAATYPEGYKSMVLVASATGFFGADGTPEFPRNTLVLFSQWEEFSGSMWASPNTRDVASGEKIQAFFGTSETVVEGQLYGSIDDGTARKLVRPVNNHPGTTHDISATQELVEWFGQTLDGGREVSGQTWWLKEIGTFIALLGGIVAVFAVGGLLTTTSYFGSIVRAVPAPAGARWGWGWYAAAALATGIPALPFIWFNTWGAQWIPADAVFAQSFTTGIAVWALLNGLIGLAILLVSRAVVSRRSSEKSALTLRSMGFTTDDGFSWLVVRRSALLAVLSVGAAYTLVLLSDWLFKTDFRLYVIQLQAMDVTRFSLFLLYLIPFTAFFLMLATTIHGTLRWTGRPISFKSEMIANAIVLPLGFVVLEIIIYVPMFLGGQIAFPAESLLTIVAYPFIAVLAIVGLLSTFFFHKTGTIYAGAFAAALLVTWNIVGGTANQGNVQEWSGLTLVLRFVIPIIVAVVLVFVTARLARKHKAEVAAESPAPVASGVAS